MRKLSRIFGGIGIIGLLVGLGIGAYAFTATNTFSGTNKAGDGSDAITPYNVSAIHYNLDPSVYGAIYSVSFTTDTSASSVQAQITGDNYLGCGGGPTVWTCVNSGTEAQAGPAVLLDVVAAQ